MSTCSQDKKSISGVGEWPSGRERKMAYRHEQKMHLDHAIKQGEGLVAGLCGVVHIARAAAQVLVIDHRELCTSVTPRHSMRVQRTARDVTDSGLARGAVGKIEGPLVESAGEAVHEGPGGSREVQQVHAGEAHGNHRDLEAREQERCCWVVARGLEGEKEKEVRQNG
jgi:hypothetical protein